MFALCSGVELCTQEETVVRFVKPLGITGTMVPPGAADGVDRTGSMVAHLGYATEVKFFPLAISSCALSPSLLAVREEPRNLGSDVGSIRGHRQPIGKTFACRLPTKQLWGAPPHFLRYRQT